MKGLKCTSWYLLNTEYMFCFEGRTSREFLESVSNQVWLRLCMVATETKEPVINDKLSRDEAFPHTLCLLEIFNELKAEWPVTSHLVLHLGSKDCNPHSMFTCTGKSAMRDNKWFHVSVAEFSYNCNMDTA